MHERYRQIHPGAPEYLYTRIKYLYEPEKAIKKVLVKKNW
jgi:hypothetical protein